MNDNPVSYKLLTNAGDNEFVVGSYMASHRHDFPFSQVSSSFYQSETEQFIKSILSKAFVMLTHLDDAPDTYFSYVIYEYKDKNIVLHYSYTKSDFRRKGLMKDTINLIMVPNAKIIATHYPKSPKIMAGFQSMFPTTVFDPFFYTRTK